MNPLPIRRMTHDAHEASQREVDQSVCGPVRGEFIVADVEPGAVGQILSYMRREQDPPSQAREILLLRAIGSGEAALGQQDDARQEHVDERLEHVDAADRPDAGTIELRFTETAPIAQHGQEDPASVLFLTCHGAGRGVPVVREVELRQDLDQGPAARFDDPDVVLCVEATVAEREDRAVLSPLVGRLSECESLQVTLFVLTQSVERLILSHDQARRGASSPRRRGGEGDTSGGVPLLAHAYPLRCMCSGSS